MIESDTNFVKEIDNMLKIMNIRNIVTFGVSAIDNHNNPYHKRVKPVGVV